MCWPAIWNGFPFLYSGDSISYLASGKVVARALALREFSAYYGDRSLIYSLGILPFHWNTSAWPIVGLNALLTAYVIWLVVRSLLPHRTVRAYLALSVPLCTLTNLGWFVGIIMPDILGPILYLSFYLLAFFGDKISRTERVALIVVSWWAVMSHASHLIIAAGLVVLITFVFILQRQSRHQWGHIIRKLAAILLAAILTQLLLYTYLIGEPRLHGNQYPFLMARVLTDDPGRWYLERRCEKPDLLICEHVHELPDSPANFLWDDSGIWQLSSPSKRERLHAEEIQVVLGTIAMYPWEQIRVSTSHFLRQIKTFGLSEHARTSNWVLENVDNVLPGARSSYMDSRQMQKTLHERLFTLVETLTVTISLLVVVVSMTMLRQRWSHHLIALASVVAFVMLANAAVTGILSQVAPRYQGRVIWLLPLLAGLLILSQQARFMYRTKSLI